ncbi:MAG: hypothetical protein IPM95_08625 [Sphingobacteriales bacterium]|jgi:hypothetical protein|nr:hypothetical protein [Sphingobacteriales bacterium]
MDAKDFELPLEGSFSNLISQCYQQQKKVSTTADKTKKKQKTNTAIIKPAKLPKR